MGMFSQNEILLMILVVSVLLIFIVILTILDIKEYRKNKMVNENDEENEMVTYEEEKHDEVKVVEVEDEVQLTKNDENLVYESTDSFDDALLLEEEEIPVKKEVELMEEVHDEPEIMYHDYVEELPKRTSLNEELASVRETIVESDDTLNKALSFEEEQERTAIISLDELMKKSNDLYNENEFVQYDDGNEPISIDEVINMYNKEEPVKFKEEVKNEVEKDLYTKKENIPFISSIYGVEKDSMSFENTATYEKLDRENSNKFMKELKEKIENQ